jgi:undecaprenyl diphosphate synthase
MSLKPFKTITLRLNSIGNLELLPKSIQKELNLVMLDKKGKQLRMVLTLALSYGSREEIISVVKKIK